MGSSFILLKESHYGLHILKVAPIYTLFVMSGELCCVCGAVCLVLHHPVPRFRLECGCCDCRQALQWAQLQGGPLAPALPDLWYFANDLTIRDNGMSIRMVATCCFSTLL